MKPKISVILPVHNGQQYLHECIASVLRQHFTSFELLIADDASTDRSREIIHGFADSRIRFFERNENVGLFANLNRLVEEARAPLVRFLGQDDVLEPDCLEREVAFFDAHPNVGISFCKTRRINEAGAEIGKGALGDLPEVMKPQLSLQHFFYHGCIPGNISTVCVKRDCFEEFGYFDESYAVAGDYEMWVRISRQRDFGVIHRHLVQLRLHARQLSRALPSRIAFIEEHRKIRASLLPHLPEEIRWQARIYFMLRQNVFDTHFAIRCLASRQLSAFWTIVGTLGLDNFTLGVVFWLVTVNNNLFRPRPKFV